MSNYVYSLYNIDFKVIIKIGKTKYLQCFIFILITTNLFYYLLIIIKN